MALTLVDQVVAKQQARSFQNGAVANAKPGVWLFLKAFWMWQGQHNPDRQFEFRPFSNLTGDTAVADAACKLYFVYLFKQDTATDAYFKIADHATVAAGDDHVDEVRLTVGKDEAILVFWDGQAMATGVTLVSSTAGDDGTTDSTSGDGPHGFVILGAA